jgi:hypothetical protein
MDDQYRLLRQKLPSRQQLFDDLRTLTIISMGLDTPDDESRVAWEARPRT